MIVIKNDRPLARRIAEAEAKRIQTRRVETIARVLRTHPRGLVQEALLMGDHLIEF